VFFRVHSWFKLIPHRDFAWPCARFAFAPRTRMTERILAFQAACDRGERIAVLTAYDYPMARLLDEAGVDVLLVGDSLGMVVLGYPDTTLVTMDEMLHHTRAVARGAQRPLILADLPSGSTETPELTVANSQRLIEAGAHAVKLEGGASHAAHIAALAAAGIPVMAHIGMQPQQVRIEGGYRIKGKTAEQSAALLTDADAVEKAGAFGLLLELVVPAVAKEITDRARVPTIGIGSGADCDGQVLVLHDVIGLFPWFKPKFATQRADVASEIRRAATEFIRDVKARIH
jgi:3-methyl-2-oxobutanoate hydroxymethyltransferase